MPTAQQVAAFLGRGDDVELLDLAEEHLPIVATFVEAYTRGQGFTDGSPGEDLDAVILTATARMVTNPTADQREQLDTYHRVPAVAGWTLPELAVLHRYRRRTA